MNKITVILLTSFLLFSCERNDMYEFANKDDSQLQITPGNTVLNLSWLPMSGAISYQVWWSDVNNPVTATLNSGNIAITNYTITGLTNFTTYYIWIKVQYEAGGTSDIKLYGMGMPFVIPSPPTINTPTPYASSLGISWTTSPGATAYEVWYSIINDSATAIQQGGDIALSTYTITGLTPTTVYYIWVKAKNAYGTSSFSTERSGAPI